MVNDSAIMVNDSAIMANHSANRQNTPKKAQIIDLGFFPSNEQLIIFPQQGEHV